MAGLYNRANSVDLGGEYSEHEPKHHAIALSGVLVYIKESFAEGLTTFKLSDLCALYACRLKELDVNDEGQIHSTRLKNRILEKIPNMVCFSEGCNVFLALEKDVGSILNNCLK